ncbi:hypothetical protein BCR37DRAFT_390612 [Protomyces lactucae-debilis]|uniref:COX assembly mitochondrial protein n=1 Tax=Protomyces lactucae-debilis TaxID=2754530 RepID=A0A1Y2FSA6_PROLT|nr:uncharacterized protein BCR37DRAFT_390612 [Protomyces lactucae-debilis]ORY86881.1 hypothetical protein BCR37DRAFT_390612 [Protomyces lactucae-debilis]
MHPPLSEHKHPGCYDLILALEECHKAGLWAKFGGACNEHKEALTLCLRAERLANQRENQRKAKARNAKAQAAWKVIDDES